MFCANVSPAAAATSLQEVKVEMMDGGGEEEHYI